MIIEMGGRRVALGADEPSAAYAGLSVLDARLGAAVPSQDAPDQTGPAIRATVEILRAHGGMTSRALLGGQFLRTASDVLTIEVLAGAPLGLGQPTTCASRLGKALVPGLPLDFAQAVVDAIVDTSRPATHGPALPAGTLRIDRAGHDEMGSSTSAFALAAELLAQVIGALSRGDDPIPVARSLVVAW